MNVAIPNTIKVIHIVNTSGLMLNNKRAIPLTINAPI
jgi:hypothetical protein